jgi:uncharacterized protein
MAEPLMFPRRQRKDSPALRLFFATDIHGSDRCFRKFLAAATVYQADVLILGGDIAGKGLVPVVAKNGDLIAEVHGRTTTVPVSREKELLDDLNATGFYGIRMSRDEAVRLDEDAGAVRRLFRDQIVAQVKAWCDLTVERLPPQVRCIVTPGNDDPTDVDPVLKSADRIECPEAELCDLGPVVLASLGTVTPTPWKTERECDEGELAEVIEAILSRGPGATNVIFNFHCPPYASGLDLAPELDNRLRPVIRAGRPSVIPVGSKAVREAIMRYQPVVGLHGHVHESRGAQKIGRTLCLNPGSDYGSGVLRGALVDIDKDGSRRDFLFTSG